MLDYDKEAESYDDLRGGEPRARAAADAVLGLVGEWQGRLLDNGCGTGIVTRSIAGARPGLRVTGVDLTPAMVEKTAVRVPGAVVRGDGRRLPFADGVFDVVTSVWLLHLLDDPADLRAVLGECARVLRAGGTYVTTVDKAKAHDVGSDIDAVLGPRPRRAAADDPAKVDAYAAEAGMVRIGQARFTGVGQGRSPRRTITDLRRGWFTLLPPGEPRTEEFAERLARLPDQDRPRADPVFTLHAYRRSG
ncbi:class I SAM-dependent methyltransferase [Streptomyces bauhiniae]|uniref:class I SAM-dependent methyltransferase n=1 Tax=Streptomyces bauhiniae TaxID=2340725 RepID=UPI003451F18A